MIPVPPLDGSRLVRSLLPVALAQPYAKLERSGFLILLGMIFLLPMLGRQIGVDLNILGWLVGTPLAWLAPIFLRTAGIGVAGGHCRGAGCAIGGLLNRNEEGRAGLQEHP
jgi:Zn-dependent protease